MRNFSVRNYVRELRDGFRILCSREFWRVFRVFWSFDAISARLDDFTVRLRENTGQEPDWDVERRRARRSRQDDA